MNKPDSGIVPEGQGQDCCLAGRATGKVQMRNLLSIFRKAKSPKRLSQAREQLQKRYNYFQRLLSETNTVLETMADMEEKLSGDYLFDMHYLRSNSNILSDKMHTIIDALNEISNGKYLELHDALMRVDSEIRAILTKKREIPVTDHTIPFKSLAKDMVDMVGGKDSNLGEVKSRVNRPTPLKGYKVLINSGVIACKGVGTGKAYLVNKKKDMNNFPDGAILIAKHTSPKFVTVMNKAVAIVTDVGSATGYMASLAREFQVPTILNTKIATKLITSGLEITVDAINGNVYEGHVDEVIDLGQKRENLFKNTYIFKTLEEVLKRIVPLNLIETGGESFRPELCKTFHDITHLANEVSMEEMFKISDEPNIKEGEAVRLVSKIPLEIYVVDLGGGIENGLKKKITADNICSIPMNALLKGMMSMKWLGHRPEYAMGFASVVAHIALKRSPSQDRSWGKSFAIISEEYMNFSIRSGYHLSTVEAYAGDNINHNYIRFHFSGGGASADRRIRRTRFIKEILEKMDFEVNRIGDVLNARITKYERSTIEEKLCILGCLAVYTKQLDMMMFSDAFVDCCFQEFMRKYYSLEARAF